MARRYGRRRRGRRGFKIPILTLAILGGQALIAKQSAGNNIVEALNVFQRFYTGIDLTPPGTGSFSAQQLAIGYGPWLVKGLIMKVARPLGAVPKIPFGIPVSLS